MPRSVEELRWEAQGLLRLDKGIGHLDSPHDHQELRVVCFNESQELIDEDTVLNRLIVVNHNRPAFTAECVHVGLVDDHSARIQRIEAERAIPLDGIIRGLRRQRNTAVSQDDFDVIEEAGLGSTVGMV